MQAGFTPLQYAVNNGHNEAVKMITNFQAQKLKSAKVSLYRHSLSVCVQTEVYTLDTRYNLIDVDYT